MSANQEVTSPVPCGAAHAKKSVDKLSVKEFRERFYIPNGVSIELSEGKVVSTENAEDNAICFSKEQFNAGLRFPLPSLFKEFLHFTQIPPAYMHPNMVRVLMGCSILSMLFNLNITLLEVLFIYSIKKLKTDIFSFVACLPSMHLVTSLPDSTKGGTKGHVLVKGIWAGLGTHPDRSFAPNRSLKVSGQNKRGKLVEWVEKASFDRLNRLFEIAAVERSCEMLLSAQNLRSVMKEPQPYVLNILPRRLPEEVEVDAQTRKARLTDREDKRKEGLLRKAPGGKRSAPSPAGAPAKKKGKVTEKGTAVKIPTPPKEFVIPPITYEAEVIIKEPENPLPPSISSGPGHVAGLNHSEPSLSAAARLAILAEEAASINTPGSPHPDAGAVKAVCADVSPLMATPMEEMGAENQSLPSVGPSLPAIPPVKGPTSRKPSSARNLKFDLIGRLQDRFQETLEVSCFFVQDDHPDGSETETATETPTVPVLVSGLRGMVQQHDLFTDLLRTTDYMKAFASQRKDSENQLHLRLEEAEASLSTAREDNTAL
uniref:Uncharacterized protein n=1 Tax=Vitis vinifera TaxID=29760 RepID=A5B883_VITVI|nr:hypothetical protein VITISV_009002 [Vitis vinifera]